MTRCAWLAKTNIACRHVNGMDGWMDGIFILTSLRAWVLFVGWVFGLVNDGKDASGIFHFGYSVFSTSAFSRAISPV